MPTWMNPVWNRNWKREATLRTNILNDVKTMRIKWRLIFFLYLTLRTNPRVVLHIFSTMQEPRPCAALHQCFKLHCLCTFKHGSGTYKSTGGTAHNYITKSSHLLRTHQRPFLSQPKRIHFHIKTILLFKRNIILEFPTLSYLFVPCNNFFATKMHLYWFIKLLFQLFILHWLHSFRCSFYDSFMWLLKQVTIKLLTYIEC